MDYREEIDWLEEKVGRNSLLSCTTIPDESFELFE